MTILVRVALLLLFIHGVPQGQDGQATQSDKLRTASISGKVTLAGEPVSGVRVTLVPNENDPAVARTRTDGDGRYSLDSLPSGYYSVKVRFPGYVAVGHGPNLSESITLQEGKKIDGLDFSLVKGGVVTGRITGPDGDPLTGLIPNLKRIDEKGSPTNDSLPYINEFDTDDRGIYRIYGITH